MDSAEELVSKAKQGDRTAFDTLHRKHVVAVTRYCARLLSNEQEGEQAAQDTFVLVWKNLPRFRGECRFESWLKIIASDVCLKLLRTKKGKDTLQRLSLDEPATLVRVEGDSAATEAKNRVADEVGTRIFAQQIICRVLECAQIDKPCWDALDLDIFELHYAQGVESKREVAERLGVKESTVKYRIYQHIEPVFEKVRREYEAKHMTV